MRAVVIGSGPNGLAGAIALGAMDLGQLVVPSGIDVCPTGGRSAASTLCSAATPPAGGANGMCGYSAARVALRDLGLYSSAAQGK